MFCGDDVASPGFWWCFDSNVDLALEDGTVGSVGLEWIIVTRRRLSGIRESIMSSIITHDINDIKMMSRSHQWVHPHAAVGAIWLGLGVLTVVIRAN